MKTEQIRWFIELSYNGAAYSGWQRQMNAPSVQQSIEEALSKVLQSNISIVGCGRTDAGVHAKSFFAHFDTQKELDPNKLTFKLNSILNKDIGIHRIVKTNPDLHARFDATTRTYRYFIQYKKDPFKLDFSHYIYGNQPDIESMNAACSTLIGTKNFSCFEKIGSDNSTSICEVTTAIWSTTEGGAYFEISANRFLRNMVRAIVGTSLDVGLKNLTLTDFKEIIAGEDRSKAGASAPAKGLFLWSIEYPNLKSYE